MQDFANLQPSQELDLPRVFHSQFSGRSRSLTRVVRFSVATDRAVHGSAYRATMIWARSGLPIDSCGTGWPMARRQGRFHGSVPRGLEHQGGFSPGFALPRGSPGSVIGARYSVMGLLSAGGWLRQAEKSRDPFATASFMIPSTETTWLRPRSVSVCVCVTYK